jgi:(4S)-4-hydroxy-5-phosphonooxypentane-2,3-dione isomerase
MFIVCARLTAIPGREEEIVEAMRAVVPASRAEPGCIAYIAHRAVDDPRSFMFYEQYVDEAAFAAHQATEHYQTWVAGRIAPALEGRERTIYDEVV